MNILAIGNSFSQDATRYLHNIAKADGVKMKVVNIDIGGCPLSYHYLCAIEDSKMYSMEFNGETTGFSTSIKEAILTEGWKGWDVITIQQVSEKSPYYETFQPYLNDLVAYIRKYSLGAKIYLHQTWAYEDGSHRLCEELGYKNSVDMLKDIKSSYIRGAEEIKADGIIPSGEIFADLVGKGLKMHRDTFHASLGIGRYALGLAWYSMLTGRDITNNSFCDFDEVISEVAVNEIKESVARIVKEREII